MRTWTFMPWRLCFPEYYGVSAAMRSIGSRVPSRMTNAFARIVLIASVGDGARADRVSMASRM